MNNRFEIKWQPFNALISSNQMLKDLEQKRSKQKLPILSNDELEELENQIKIAYHTKEKIEITYFYNQQYYTKKSIIIFLNKEENKIYFSDNTSLFFEQIITIKFSI